MARGTEGISICAPCASVVASMSRIICSLHLQRLCVRALPTDGPMCALRLCWSRRNGYRLRRRWSMSTCARCTMSTMSRRPLYLISRLRSQRLPRTICAGLFGINFKSSTPSSEPCHKVLRPLEYIILRAFWRIRPIQAKALQFVGLAWWHPGLHDVKPHVVTVGVWHECEWWREVWCCSGQSTTMRMDRYARFAMEGHVYPTPNFPLAPEMAHTILPFPVKARSAL